MTIAVISQCVMRRRKEISVKPRVKMLLAEAKIRES